MKLNKDKSVSPSDAGNKSKQGVPFSKKPLIVPGIVLAVGFLLVVRSVCRQSPAKRAQRCVGVGRVGRSSSVDVTICLQKYKKISLPAARFADFFHFSSPTFFDFTTFIVILWRKTNDAEISLRLSDDFLVPVA